MQISNRTYAWLMGSLTSSIVLQALLIQHASDVAAAWVWVRWVLVAIAGILVLYGLLVLWHKYRVRALATIKQKDEIRLTRASALHSQEMERERLRLEQMKLQLEHERLMFAARHIAVEGGLIVGTEQGYLTIPLGRSSHIAQNSVSVTEVVAYPDPVDFAHVLQGFTPSAGAIYLLNTLNGPVTVPLNKTCHIGLAGTTGGGKTNTLRMILAQALACGAAVYMANPNFAPVKINERSVEDWRPIAARLAAPVARKIDEIKRLITQAVEELDQRRERQQVEVRREREFYLVLGEWPAIVSRWKEAPDEVGKLLREARQYGIYVISEMQDALVKTIGGSSGLRECYRTVYYFGGDATTARVLLDAKGVDEAGLGDRGACYVRSYSAAASKGRVPFCSNASVYALLGTPTSGALPDIDDGTVEGRPMIIDPNEPPFTDEMGGPQNGMNTLVESVGATPDERPIYSMMEEEQAAQFVALYPVVGSVDKCLDKIEGCNHRHRQHARELIGQHGLRSRA